jgi:hypothetical protein
MLTLLTRLTRPHASRTNDRLFTAFAPDGAPAEALSAIYHQYDGAFDDEPLPPKHHHFRALADAIMAADRGNLRKLYGGQLRRVHSAYVACFEPAETFAFQLSLWRHEPDFRDELIEARSAVIADLLAEEAALAAQRTHFARLPECLAAPIDLAGASLLDQIKQMQPDDWHEIALNWDLRSGVSELKWITAQRTCDRATALYVLCLCKPGAAATGGVLAAPAGFVRALAARIEGGYCPSAEFTLRPRLRQRAAFARDLGVARETGLSPWQIPEELLDHVGVREHRPRYGVTNGAAHYHYEAWLARNRHTAR